MKESNFFGNHIIKDEEYSFCFCSKTDKHWVMSSGEFSVMS